MKNFGTKYDDRQKEASEIAMRPTGSLDAYDGADDPERGHRFNGVFHHYRYLVVMLGGLACGCMMVQRFSISVALLNMVNQTDLYLKSNPEKTYEDFLSEGYTEGGEFIWDNEIQNIIMSWYMIAYTLPQIATTKLALLVGPRRSIPVAMLLCAGSNLLIPIVAHWSWHWVVGLRLVNGIGGSFVIPIVMRAIEQWMIYDEISLGLTISQILQVILSSTSSLIAGYLSSIHWMLAFYIPGAVTILFGLLYYLLVTDQPEDNCLTSERELNTIHKARLLVKNTHVIDNIQHKQEDRQPTMIDVLKVPSFYAYLLLWTIHCSSTISTMFLQPTYLRQFFHIDISQTGFLCTVIEAGTIIAAVWPHPMVRWLQSCFKLSLTASRRITYGLVCCISATTWICIGTFHQYQLLLFFLNRCSDGATSVLVMGSLMSNYSSAGLSSISFSIMNTIGNGNSVFLSTFFGWFLDFTGQSEAGWFWIYFMVSVGQLFIILTFSTLIRSDPIEFNKEKRSVSDSA